MRHEKLFEPVDGAEPCGPDLDEVGDEDYLNYMLPAEDRLPASFFDKTGAPVDRSGIDLRAEVKAISALLERSRDLRLLALEARFQVSAGQFLGFSECIQAIAGLVARFWGEIHPVGFDGDFTLRQNTLASLDDRAKVILPLQFATIARDKRLGQISYRSYAVATGVVQPRADEKVPDAAAIVDALGSDDNRPAVDSVHASLVATRDALASIRNSFIENSGYDYVPDFDTLVETIRQICELIEKGRPDLAANAVPLDKNEADAPADDSGSPSDSPAQAAIPVARTPAVVIAGQQEASAALAAAEAYFASQEPSALALILVRQARLLIGMPLVAALEALVPETVEKATIRLDGGLKFQLDMARMRLLSGAPVEPAGPAPAVSAAALKFSATSRAEASVLISGVEAYFRRYEPSSPVPMLLAKAQGFLNSDFLAILKDLMVSDN